MVVARHLKNKTELDMFIFSVVRYIALFTLWAIFTKF